MTLKERIHSITNKKQHSILSASIILAITFGLSAILGFLRSRFLNNFFFKDHAADLDVYIAAFRIPYLFFKLLVSGALSDSFIPVYSSYLHKDKKEADRLGSAVISFLLFSFIILSVLIFIFALPLCQIIASGFDDSQIHLMVNLTRILLLGQIFFLISNFITAILQVNQVFLVSAISPIVYNFFIILSIFTLAPAFGIYGPVYGAVIGAFFHLAIQLPILKKQNFNFYPILSLKIKGVKEVVKLMLPRSLSLGLSEIENTVTLFFTSNLATGSVVLLNLAMQLMYLPSRIFGTTVGQASLPILSKNIARNELTLFNDTVKKIIIKSLYITLPATFLVLIHRLAIVRLTFGSREFPWSATLQTAKTLAFLTPAIFSQSVSQILVRSFYALHDTKTPLRVSFLSLIFNISSAYFFVNYTTLGIVGLAIGASVTNLTQCLGLSYLFIKKVKGFDYKDLLSRISKIVIASFVMAICSWGLMQFTDTFILDTSRTINVAVTFTISVLFSIFVYFLSSFALNIEEYRDYQRFFKKIKRFIFKR